MKKGVVVAVAAALVVVLTCFTAPHVAFGGSLGPLDGENEALARVAKTQQVLVAASRELDDALKRLAESKSEVIEGDERLVSSATELVVSRVDAANSAAASFVAGGREDGVLVGVLVPEMAGARTMLRAVADGRAALVVQNAANWREAGVALQAAAARMADAEAAVRQAAARLERARLDAVTAIEELAAAKLRAAQNRLLAEDSSITGIPRIALRAYMAASEWAKTDLGCDAPWWTVAAVGRHESHHGSYLAVLMEDGSVLPHLFGIPLDGTRSLAVRDTDNGAMDDDPVWDRAMGPMQVLPQTWSWYAGRYELDADQNTVEDPHNINDATRLTAAMLCRNGGDLRTEAGLRRAYWAYNPSLTYNDTVLGTALEYAKLGAR